MQYQNYQFHYECQLVALWNAARFHRLDVPEPAGMRYQEICDDARCLFGGCINIDRECERLGMIFIPGEMTLSWVRRNLPVHFAVFCHRGYHSVLGVALEGTHIKLANYARNRLHSISWDVLKEKVHKKVRPYSIVVGSML